MTYIRGNTAGINKRVTQLNNLISRSGRTSTVRIMAFLVITCCSKVDDKHNWKFYIQNTSNSV